MNRFTLAWCLGAALAAGALPASAQQIVTRPQLDAILGGNQILEDFESFSIAAGTAATLNVFALDSTTIANSQGPGLVEPCARYHDPASVQLQWNGNNYQGVPTKTLMANGGIPMIEITYPFPGMNAVGFDILGFLGFGYNGAAAFFDANGNHIDTVSYSVPGGATPFFMGYQHQGLGNIGIGRVQIRGSNGWNWSPILDNHGYGRRGPVIRITGTCPGTVQIFWALATPSQTMRFLFSPNLGSVVVPSGPCMGTQLGLGTPITVVSPPLPGNTGPTGSGSVLGTAGPGACLRYLQLIVQEPASSCQPCLVSNVAQFP